ncbi:MAG: hypothetical protein FJ130_10875 [Deltaproteobacteria bacterium]|nr:hypothetical protein [Deltaproteobacteria bacterium]
MYYEYRIKLQIYIFGHVEGQMANYDTASKGGAIILLFLPRAGKEGKKESFKPNRRTQYNFVEEENKKVNMI